MKIIIKKNNFFNMPIVPKISSALQKKHKGKVAIYLHGKSVAFGENTIEAVQNAKKIISNIEDQEFVISRVHHKYLAV